MNHQLCISSDNLRLALQLVPVKHHLEFFERLTFGSLDGPALVRAPGFRSYPLSPTTASKLATGGIKLDFIRAIISNADASVQWREVQTLAGGMEWGAFARSVVGTLHRTLRRLTGVADAELVWEGNDWTQDPITHKWVDGPYRIDGPAVDTLREVFGVRVGA